jgi:hypothetical protein
MTRQRSTSSALRLALAVLTSLGALGLVGCDKAKALLEGTEPETIPYVIVFRTSQDFADTSVDGAVLLVDGVEAGPLRAGTAWADRGSPGVNLAWPSKHTLSDHTVKLGLRFPTPCGTEDVALDDYSLDVASAKSERMMRKHASESDKDRYLVKLTLGPKVKRLETFTVWVDDRTAPNAKITFGKADITEKVAHTKHGTQTDLGRRRVLWDVKCASEHAVSIDGKPLGVAKTDDKNATAFLVSTEPGICYRLTNAVYQASTAPSFGRDDSWYFEGSQVLGVGARELDFFLEPLPGGVAAGGGSVTMRAQLDRCACKPALKAKR